MYVASGGKVDGRYRGLPFASTFKKDANWAAYSDIVTNVANMDLFASISSHLARIQELLSRQRLNLICASFFQYL